MRALQDDVRADVSTPTHGVRFYEHDAALVPPVTAFLATALAAGDAAIAIATPEHLAEIELRLEAAGFDLQEARDDGRWTPLEAADVVAEMVVDGALDDARFARTAGALIAGAGGRRVHVFGEMVNLLCARGEPQAALRLEALWNEQLKRTPVSLLCAYSIRILGAGYDVAALRAICAAHADVVPAESYSALTGPEERLRAIVELQLRTQALEQEVATRRREQDALASELRTPLATVQSTVTSARLDPECGARALELATRAAEQLAHLIDDLDEAHRAAGAAAIAAETPAGPAPRRGRGADVLVVEDDADAAEGMSMLLERLGHRVRTALDGPSALALARAHPPHLVLLDIGLPGMNGYAVARAFRADPALRSAMLVALTGYGQPAARRQAVEAGFDHLVVKPVDRGTLQRLLAGAVRIPRGAAGAPMH